MRNPPKKQPITLDRLSPELSNLREIAGDEMMQAAFALVRERLKLTPEKLALMIVRTVAPDEIIKKGEEAIIRGVDHEKLKGHKDRKELPELMNGTACGQ